MTNLEYLRTLTDGPYQGRDNYTEFIDPKEEYMTTLIVEEGMERRKARRKAERWWKKNQNRE